MTFLEKPFWWDTTTFPTPDPKQTLPQQVDVAVIGSGYTGLSAARVLAQRGARVAVLEAESIGWGASSRNGGMTLTGLKLGIPTLIQKYGRDLTRRLFAASLASIDCVEQIVQAEQIDCNFARCGHLETAYKPAHYQHYVEAAEFMAREVNHKVRVVPKADLHTEIGSTIYHGGLVDELSAGVNPARYVAGLARAAEKAGAQLFEQARVTEVRRANAAFAITTARGALTAREVLVATSGYTGRATPALQKKIIPIGSYIIATESLSADLARAVSPRNRMIFDSKNFLYYFRLSADNRMVFGGRAGFFPETPSTVRESAAILQAAMISVYPQLRDARVEYAWGGTLDFTFDIMPHTGKMNGLHYALGYAGHGVALGTYLGAKMGETILGDAIDNPFAEIPFPGAPLGLYNGNPWFLPFAEVWYKWLDWVS